MSSQEKEIKKILAETQKKIDTQKEKQIREKIPDKVESIKLNSSWVRELVQKVTFIYKMVFDPTFSISKEHKLMFMAALLYFLIPTDLIADFIPVTGLLDDALVLKLVWKSLQDEIHRYEAHLGLHKTQDSE